MQWPAVKRGEGTVWVRVSDFRWNNKHLEIGADGDVDPGYPGFGCLDFRHPEARDERFAIVEETVRRYPVDGFELSLNSFPYFFAPHRIEEGRPILTEWVRRVSETVRGSGADRDLLVKVPTNLAGGYSLGLAVEEWIRQGLVDVLVVQDRPGVVNQMADFRPLVKAARDRNPDRGGDPEQGRNRPAGRGDRRDAPGHGVQLLGSGYRWDVPGSGAGFWTGPTKPLSTRSCGSCPTRA